MNKVILSGRFTKDADIRYSTDNKPIARFNLAVNRKYKTEGQDADFISCVAFGKTAEFIEKYFAKGSKIDLVGRIQTGSYTNTDGKKVYTTDVVVEEVEFGESKKDAESKPVTDNDGFADIPEGVDEELPFAPVSR